jgi:hypothetical protein
MMDTCLCFIYPRALVRIIPEYETAVANKLWGFNCQTYLKNLRFIAKFKLHR